MMKKLLSRFCVLALVLCACPLSALAAEHPVYWGQHGSAKFIGGRTVVVSIFADDANTDWNFERERDCELYWSAYERMGIGFSWLEDRAADYGVEAEILWDCEEYASLFHMICFSEDLTDSDQDFRPIVARVREEVDIDGIVEEFDADNIVVALHLNAPSSDQYRSYCRTASFRSVGEDEYVLEMCVYVPYGHDRENTPAVYAHELMHCFGAYDLYYATDSVPITQAYVDHLQAIGFHDIMNYCYFSRYDQVSVAFSEVDAYYLGLLSGCSDVDAYGLGPSIFERWH